MPLRGYSGRLGLSIAAAHVTSRKGGEASSRALPPIDQSVNRARNQHVSIAVHPGSNGKRRFRAP
jgi:hypothetical protein